MSPVRVRGEGARPPLLTSDRAIRWLLPRSHGYRAVLFSCIVDLQHKGKLAPLRVAPGPGVADLLMSAPEACISHFPLMRLQCALHTRCGMVESL